MGIATDIYWIIEWVQGTIPMYYCGDLDWSFHRKKVYRYYEESIADDICRNFNEKLGGNCTVIEVIINDN